VHSRIILEIQSEEGTMCWLRRLSIAIIIVMMAVLLLYISSSLESLIPREGTGIVRSRDFIPAHTTTSIILVGAVPVPTEVDHPDSWQVTLDVEGQLVEVKVTQEFYEEVQPGTQIEVVYGKGFLFNEIRVMDIR
jgi:hypothetical protein